MEMNGVSRDGGVTMSYHGIEYKVEQGGGSKCKKQMKTILSGLSGLFPPGLNAIMGPTGSGKTSLLDVLAQRKDPKGLTGGFVLVNGKSVHDNFRIMSGYVVQEDVLMGTLTVKENLMFSANLRLSHDKFTEAERMVKVEEVIQQLNLQNCADTAIGTEFTRGVSGGEKKRVSIGMELIIDPKVMFLDEPTTGLDANTASTIILLLYKLASSGRNIIMSIHQPRYSIYALFDKLLILNKGEMVYRGSAKTATEYFKNIGYECPQYHNPPDFFLDVVGGDIKTAQLLDSIDHRNGSNGAVNPVYPSLSDEVQVAIETDKKTDPHDRLIDRFRASAINVEENKRVLELEGKYDQQVKVKSCCPCLQDEMNIDYQTGFGTQLKVMSWRTWLNFIRNPMTTYVQFITGIIVGVLIGLIYFQMDTVFPSALQNRSGLFFFYITAQIMTNLSALQIFINDRNLFRHESASGYYRASVYFLSRIFVDLIPNRLIPILTQATIMYFMAGLQGTAAKFFIFFLICTLTSISAAAVAFSVSSSCQSYGVANALVSLPFIFMMLFGGFLANVETILPWLAWIKWFSIFRYGINGLSVNEYEGLVFIDNSTQPGFDSVSCINSITGARFANCVTGVEALAQQGIVSGAWGLWQNVLALSCIALGFLLFSYIGLRRVNKYK